MGSTVQADAKFLRRVLMGLVFLTLVTGAMAGLTTVQAMTEAAGHCRPTRVRLVWWCGSWRAGAEVAGARKRRAWYCSIP